MGRRAGLLRTRRETVAMSAVPPWFGLTMPQIDIYVDQMMHPRKPIYNTGQTIEIRAHLDEARFVEALRRVVAETDGLRIRVFRQGTRVVQEILPAIEAPVSTADFSRAPNPDAAAAAWVEQSFWSALSPNDWPLYHFALAKLDEGRFLWLQKYHHLVVDAAARQFVAERVAAAYDALSAGNVPAGPNVSYRTAKTSEDEYLASSRYESDGRYWNVRLAGSRGDVFGGQPGASERSRSGRPRRLDCSLTPAESDALHEFAGRQRSTVFKLLVCLAWSCFSRLYGKADLVFGIAVANRPTPETKHIVGLFSKVIPFRPRLAADMTLVDALARIDADLAEDLPRQRFPISHLNRGRRQDDKIGRHDVAINYVRSDYSFRVGGGGVSCTNLSAGFSEPWRIMVLDYKGASAIRVVFDYDHGRIPEEEASRLSRGLTALLLAAPHSADRLLGAMAIEA